MRCASICGCITRVLYCCLSQDTLAVDFARRTKGLSGKAYKDVVSEFAFKYQDVWHAPREA